jgi:hypothetical protein
MASSPVTASGATTAAGRRTSHVGNPLALRLINAATATVERMPVAAPARIAALRDGVAVDFLGIVSPVSLLWDAFRIVQQRCASARAIASV